MRDARLSTIIKHLEAVGVRFEAATDCPWLEQVEVAFRRRLPEPYRSLVTFFRFPEFVVSEFESFSNLGDGSSTDLTVAPFKDPALRDWLTSHGFMQIGRPASGSYDPVCFDMRAKAATPKVVRFDHEDILLSRKRIEPVLVAESFVALVGANAA